MKRRAKHVAVQAPREQTPFSIGTLGVLVPRVPLNADGTIRRPAADPSPGMTFHDVDGLPLAVVGGFVIPGLPVLRIEDAVARFAKPRQSLGDLWTLSFFRLLEEERKDYRLVYPRLAGSAPTVREIIRSCQERHARRARGR